MAEPFRFQTVPTIVVQFGAARRLGALLRERYPTLARLCLVTDGFLHRSGLLAPALADLAQNGWNVTVLDNVVADPPEHVVLEAAAQARDAQAQIVIGLGGGSSMDVAKLLAVLLASGQPLSEMYGVNKVEAGRVRVCHCTDARRCPAPRFAPRRPSSPAPSHCIAASRRRT